jgi:hypothetical protein
VIIDPEIVHAAQAVWKVLSWLAVTIATLLGDSLSSDRKGRQKRRREKPEEQE